MLNILTRLKTQNNFSHNEQLLVDYILQHPQDVIDMNAKQLSQACFVSKSSIYRLCEKIELSGFSDLKVKISQSLHNYQKEDEVFDFDFPVKEYQTHYEIIEKIKEDYEKTLVSTANLFDLDQIREVVQAMKKAKHIDIYTSAGNIYFAQNFKFQMQEIGTFVNVPIEEYHQLLTASTSDESHVAIIVSFEGRGFIIEKLARTLKTNKTPIILISSTNKNSLTKYANYHLYLSSNENHYNKISSFSTRLSLLYILDCIYTSYFKFNYNKNITYKLDAYKKLSDK